MSTASQTMLQLKCQNLHIDHYLRVNYYGQLLLLDALWGFFYCWNKNFMTARRKIPPFPVTWKKHKKLNNIINIKQESFQFECLNTIHILYSRLENFFSKYFVNFLKIF